jgi:hypothetical protein
MSESTDPKLIPRTPPGRANRRARAFGDEITRLRQKGYGYVAIQEALADAGVIVSKSTVQREVARLCRQPSVPARGFPAVLVHQRVQTDPTESFPPPRRSPDKPRSGKDITESFMKGRITNPLFRNRSVT